MANTPGQTRKEELRPGQTGAGHQGGAGSTVADRAKEAASSATQSAGSMASNLGHKAQETASELASSAGQRAREATSSVGSGMQGFAHTLRENLPHEGMVGRASSAVADRLESSGRYLQEEGFNGMIDDLSGVIRRNPIPAVLIGLGLGFLLGRTLRS
jgi:phage-related protein